jgi:ribosomal protein S18 acetylase RimI-like enzyme
MQDLYFITRDQDHIQAYWMLRGWDEGYTIPSLGCAVHPQARGRGLAHAVVRHALATARSRGARRIRLTVHKANLAAAHIYRKFGFVFTQKNADEWLGHLDLGAAERSCRPAA